MNGTGSASSPLRRLCKFSPLLRFTYFTQPVLPLTAGRVDAQHDAVELHICYLYLDGFVLFETCVVVCSVCHLDISLENLTIRDIQGKVDPKTDKVTFNDDFTIKACEASWRC